MATTHLFQISSINHPKAYYSFNTISAMVDGGRAVVRAEPGHLSLNFASHVVQGMAMGDLDEIDGILWEARRVMTEEGDYPPSTTNLYDDFEREGTDFLDFISGMTSLNGQDVINSAKQAVRALYLAPV